MALKGSNLRNRFGFTHPLGHGCGFRLKFRISSSELHPLVRKILQLVGIVSAVDLFRLLDFSVGVLPSLMFACISEVSDTLLIRDWVGNEKSGGEEVQPANPSVT